MNKICQHLKLNNQSTKPSTGTLLERETGVKHGAATDLEVDYKNGTYVLLQKHAKENEIHGLQCTRRTAKFQDLGSSVSKVNIACHQL
jgi:hypothetical protein